MCSEHPSRRLALVFLGGVVALGALSAASTPDAGTPSSERSGRVHVVRIKAMAFVPERISVVVGDTIEWVNEDFVPHTATAEARSGDEKPLFDSGVLPVKGTFRYRASAAGTFPYVCLLHPNMKGTIEVNGR